MNIAGTFPKGKGEVRWVGAEWLAEHLEDGVRIIDCQPNVHDFIRGHVHGAVYLAEESLRISRDGMPHVWLPARMAEEVFRSIGLDDGQTALVYTSANPGLPTGDGVPQGMLAYSLARYGCGKVLQLDGGLEAWVGGGGRLETRYAKTGEGDFRARPRNDLAVTYDEFLALMGRGDVVHIDSRPAAQYRGRSPWPKEGHIPGAINVPWSGMFTPENIMMLRTEEELKHLFLSRGAPPGKKVVCHCGSGRKAAAQLCVLKWRLGYPEVRLFEGSLTEWCSNGQPTSTGDE